MSSDGGGSDGQGNQNEAQNDIDAQLMNAEITGDYDKYNSMVDAQSAAAMGVGTPWHSQPAPPSAPNSSLLAMESLGNTVGNLTSLGQTVDPGIQQQMQQIANQRQADQFAAEGLAFAEMLDEFEDDKYGGYTGTPNTFSINPNTGKYEQDAMPGVGANPYGTGGAYNLQEVEEAQKDSEQGFFGGLFGANYAPEFVEGEGWRSINNTSLKDVATSPVGSLVAGALGAPALLAAGVKSYDMLTPETNKYGSIVMDQTKNYDPTGLDSLFGPNPQYSPSNNPNVFGDDGGNNESTTMFGRRMPRRQPVRQAPVQAPVEDNLPPVAGPLDYYQQDYEKQYSYWDGNKFVLAPFVRKV